MSPGSHQTAISSLGRIGSRILRIHVFTLIRRFLAIRSCFDVTVCRIHGLYGRFIASVTSLTDWVQCDFQRFRNLPSTPIRCSFLPFSDGTTMVSSQSPRRHPTGGESTCDGRDPAHRKTLRGHVPSGLSRRRQTSRSPVRWPDAVNREGCRRGVRRLPEAAGGPLHVRLELPPGWRRVGHSGPQRGPGDPEGSAEAASALIHSRTWPPALTYG